MHLTINSNPSATSASLNLSQAMDAHRRSLARLSSGNRIVNPADDAGGLAVAKKLDSSLKRLVRVGQNLGNAQSFTELQETALRTVGGIITRMSELKTMSMDVSKNSADNENYNKEFVELQKQILAITKHGFNGVSLFSTNGLFVPTHEDGSPTKGLGLGRNFVFGEYIAESGAVLGQESTSTTATTTTSTDGGSGTDTTDGTSGGGETEPTTGTNSNTYTLDQWRADYDEWINYDDSNWDNDFLTWMADPEPYGGVDVLNYIKSVRDANGDRLNLGAARFNGIEIEDLTPIAGLKSVTILSLPGSRISSGNFDPLASLPQLEIISGLSGESLKPLAGLTNLTNLNATHGNLTDLQGVENLTQLEWLDVQGNNITDISGLSTLENIFRLRLDRNQISDISALSNLVNIERLYLGENQITDISSLSNLTSAIEIHINKNQLVDISPLLNLIQIEQISLNDNEISNISPLQNLTNINWLRLDHNNISDLSPLVGMTSASSIDLGGYWVGMEDPPEKENPITQSQKDMLEAALPDVPISWPNIILPDSEEPEEPEEPTAVTTTTTTTTTGYASLDQFTTKDFTNFIESVADAIAEVGSHQSRLGFELRTNQISQVNNEAAVGRLMDVDIALESTKLAQTSVKVQSASSMVAKANELTDIAIRMLINR